MKQRDLFDRGDKSQPGERQVDLEDIIAEAVEARERLAAKERAGLVKYDEVTGNVTVWASYGESLLGLIEAGDDAGEQEWIERAKRGEILRIM